MSALLEQDQADFKAVSEFPRFMIRNTADPSLYWSNEDGWVDYTSATVFNGLELEHLRLPDQGQWVRMDESRCRVLKGSDLRPMLGEDFEHGVLSGLGSCGFLVEQEWRTLSYQGADIIQGPALTLRCILETSLSEKLYTGGASSAVQSLAGELREKIVTFLPEASRRAVAVLPGKPRWVKEHRQWCFELALVALNPSLLVEEEGEDYKELYPPRVPRDFAMPEGLSPQGKKAWSIIVGVLASHDSLNSSGHTHVFYSPAQWRARKEEYGLDSDLIVVHEGGDHAAFFDYNHECYGLIDEMDTALRKEGLYPEQATSWYSSVYGKRSQIVPVLVPEAKNTVEEATEDSELGSPLKMENRIRQVLTSNQLEIAAMQLWPANPGWGELGRPQWVFVTLLRPSPEVPFAAADGMTVAFEEFLQRVKSQLGEVLETTDIDYRSFHLGSNLWQITWFVGDPAAAQVEESEEEEETWKDVMHLPFEFKVGDRVRSLRGQSKGMEGWISHRINSEPNSTWWVIWGRDKSLDRYMLSSELELIDRPELDDVQESAATDLASAAKDAEEPSEAQKEAGNYKKGHVRLWGFDISIENAKGSERSGKDAEGKEWSVTMPAHYGYIKGTQGKDKDHVDVYIGPSTDSEKVFVVNQNEKKDGAFDEHKVMLGFEDRDKAIATYDKAYTGDLGPKLRGSVVSTTIDAFKAWLDKGNKKEPFKELAQESSDAPEDFDFKAHDLVRPVYTEGDVARVLNSEEDFEIIGVGDYLDWMCFDGAWLPEKSEAAVNRYWTGFLKNHLGLSPVNFGFVYDPKTGTLTVMIRKGILDTPVA